MPKLTEKSNNVSAPGPEQQEKDQEARKRRLPSVLRAYKKDVQNRCMKVPSRCSDDGLGCPNLDSGLPECLELAAKIIEEQYQFQDDYICRCGINKHKGERQCHYY